MSEATTRAHELESEELLRELRDRMPEKPIMEYSRNQFEALLPDERLAAVRRGAKINNGGAPAAKALPEGGLRRADFEQLSAPDRHKFVMAGHAIAD